MTAQTKTPPGGSGGAEYIKHSELSNPNTAERAALNRLKDAVLSLGLSAGQAVALHAAASSYAKAQALRILAERAVQP